MIVALSQIGGAVPSSPAELVRHATPVTQGVLILLALLSLVSWAVMLGAWREIARTLKAGRGLLRELEKTTRLEQASALIRHAPASPFTRLYMVAMQFVSDTRALNQQVREREMDDPVIAPPAVSLTGSQVETLHLILDTEAMGERDRLGRYLPWLATIGSVSRLNRIEGLFETFGTTMIALLVREGHI